MEKHIFGREENITISAGTEAVLRISGLKSRLYIRGMKGYADTGKGEPMYQNRKKLGWMQVSETPRECHSKDSA